MNRPIIPHSFLWLGLLLQAPLALASDGIATDGSMGTAQTLSGAHVIVPQNLGTTTGTNLFHSFSEFNVAGGQTVEFTGSDALENVVSRVTGPDISNIDGTLKSSISHAAFYFINPNGVVFGAGGQVDVPGAFHVSTADKIDFNNGGVFYADLHQTSSLSAEAPAAFGFLDTSTANNGLIDVNAAELSVKPGQKLDVVAGDITVENAGANNAHVVASAGEIRLVAMQGKGTVSLQQNADGTLPLPDATPTASNAGHVTVNALNAINGPATLDATGIGGGRIAVWGGDAAFSQSSAWADNTGDVPATAAKGVEIRTNSLNVDNSIIAFDVSKKGDSGNVTVATTTALRVVNGGGIKTTTYGSGNAGNVKVSADTLTIDKQNPSSGPTGIYSETALGSSGNAGTVAVNARTIDILNGGAIETNTVAPGNAGQVTVTADTLTINNQNSPALGGIYSINAATSKNINTGNSGNVAVRAGKLEILNGGVIWGSTSGTGNAGNVEVTAKTLKIDNQGNSSDKGTGIFSEAQLNSKGNAGTVTVDAGTLEILNAGKVSTTTFAQGDAGNVVVTANALKVDGQGNPNTTGIFSQADKGSSGQGGNVSVHANTMDIINGGQVSSTTSSQGHAGKVAVSTDNLTIDGLNNPSKVTGIFSQAKPNSSGQVGDIAVLASNTVNLSNGAKISIENAANVADPSTVKPGAITVTARDINMKDSAITTTSTGNIDAGSVNINFSHWLNMDPSFIQTTANSGNGGTISIGGGELIYLQDSGFKTSVSGANSNGGDILVYADNLLMNSGIVQANAVGGSGGNITLGLKSLIPSSNSLILGGRPVIWQPFVPGFNVIQAASQAGISGTLNVTAPQLNLSGILANLGGPQFDTSIISQDYCGLGVGSSLTRIGTGGLKPKSGEHLEF